MKDNKDLMRVFDFSAAKTPSFAEVVNNKDYVLYGEDNLFPQHLITLYDYSSLNRTCINAKRDGVIGKGLYTEDEQDKVRLVMANSTESVYDVYKKCALDMILFGGYSLNVIWKNDRSLGIAEIYHVDFSKLRAGKTNELDVITEYHYSADWSKIRKFPPKTLPSFDVSNDEPSQIFYVKNYTPNQSYYPNCDYLGSTTSIQLDIEVKNFHLNNIQNSLHPSMWVNLANGIPSEEEREMVFNHLNDKYSSGNNAGKLFVSFSEDKDSSPEITPIQSNGSDNLFTSLNELIQNNILTGHRISSPLLLGIQRPGALGGRQEMIDSSEHFLNLVIKPIQEELLKTFDKLLFMRDGKMIDIKVEQSRIVDIDDIDINELKKLEDE